MDRSFPALFSRSSEMEPTLRSAQVLKQEAEDLGFEGKEILDYVKEQQKLDREEKVEKNPDSRLKRRR